VVYRNSCALISIRNDLYVGRGSRRCLSEIEYVRFVNRKSLVGHITVHGSEMA